MEIKIEKPKHLVYGNLDRDSLEYLKEENVFTNLYDKFIKFPYPNIVKTFDEINDLIDLQNKAIKKKTWENYAKFMYEVDESIDDLFMKECNKLGIEYKQQYLNKIQDKLGGLVMRLKQYYNRPRPYQVAYYTDQDFHNFNTFSGNTPAYPSGHATQSYFTALIISHHNPEHSQSLLKLAERITKAREVMGVHYASDSYFGKTIAESLCKHKSIKDIYLKNLKHKN